MHTAGRNQCADEGQDDVPGNEEDTKQTGGSGRIEFTSVPLPVHERAQADSASYLGGRGFTLDHHARALFFFYYNHHPPAEARAAIAFSLWLQSTNRSSPTGSKLPGTPAQRSTVVFLPFLVWGLGGRGWSLAWPWPGYACQTKSV